jgi:hypothetical protein
MHHLPTSSPHAIIVQSLDLRSGIGAREGYYEISARLSIQIDRGARIGRQNRNMSDWCLGVPGCAWRCLEAPSGDSVVATVWHCCLANIHVLKELHPP